MKPNSILGMYLIKQVLFNFMAVLFMVLSVVLTFEIIELLRRASGNDDISFWFVLQMSIVKLPKTLDLVFPFIMMIAAMVTFWKLSKTSEFVIIRAAGVSIWGFLVPVLVLTFLIGLTNIMLINPISSRMYETYETMEYKLKSKNKNAMMFTDKGLWTREAIDNKILVLQAKSLRQEEENLLMREVSILELTRESQILRRVEAFAATLDKKQNFELKDVKVFEAGKPTIYLPNISYKTNLSQERIKENFVNPEAISFWKLPATIHFYEVSGFSPLKHKMRYMSLWALPFLLCAMVLVASLFALRANTRKGGVLYLIVGGIVTGFGVYFISQLIYAFGLNGYIPPSLAVWTPSLIITLIAVSVLLHLEDG